MSQEHIETIMTWRGGCWQYKREDIRYFLRDDGALIHGIVRRGPEPGNRVIDALARMTVQPDGCLLFRAGDAVVRTLPAGTAPAEVAAVWEEITAVAALRLTPPSDQLLSSIPDDED